MVLVDSSVWTDHFRSADPLLLRLLMREEVLAHRFVIGELMLAGLYRRPDALRELRMLPAAPLPTPTEVERLIEAKSLDGRGIGYVDATLLAAVRLLPGARLWTRDRRLAAVAAETGVEFPA
jgi:predicted nucleic acid-binding protein